AGLRCALVGGVLYSSVTVTDRGSPRCVALMWHGRPAAQKASRAERCTDLRKRRSPASETVIGNRCLNDLQVAAAGRRRVSRPAGVRPQSQHEAQNPDGYDRSSTITGPPA